MPTLKDEQISSVAMNSLSEALSFAAGEPMRQLAREFEAINKRNLELFQDVINAVTISQSLINSLKPMFEYQESLGKILAASISIKPFIVELPKLNLFQTYFGNVNIIEGEIQNQPENKTETAIATRPDLTPALQTSVPTQRAKMGLKEVLGGFKYKGRVIKKVSHRNAEGRFLSLLLSSNDCFARDEEIYEKLHLNVGRSFSWVLRNLKNKFKDSNFLRLEIERRWDPDGYVIVGVSYIN